MFEKVRWQTLIVWCLVKKRLKRRIKVYRYRLYIYLGRKEGPVYHKKLLLLVGLTRVAVVVFFNAGLYFVGFSLELILLLSAMYLSYLVCASYFTVWSFYKWSAAPHLDRPPRWLRLLAKVKTFALRLVRE